MARFVVLASLVLVPVLSAGCASSTRVGASSAPLDSLRTENTSLQARLNRIEDSLAMRRDVRTGQYFRDRRVLQDRLNRLTYEARTLRDGGHTVRVLSADSLFAGGTATLTARGKKQLRSVIGHLHAAYPARTVRVEGHTSNTPLGEALREQFASNWELSAARATTVVRHLIVNSDLAPTQFVAVGYGATDPVASNKTVRGRRRNRRVRVSVLPPPRDYSRPFETAW